MKKFLALLSLTLVLTSCDDEGGSILDDLLGGSLTEGEVVEGLISALDVGLANAVVEASGPESESRTTETPKGYLQNELIKILLPENVNNLRNALNEGGSVPISVDGINFNAPVSKVYDAYKLVKGVENDPFDNLIESMNRGAEGAAKSALPIFGNAIKNLSFSDAFNILQGSDTAATNFFFVNTNQQLISTFGPKIDSSLNVSGANAFYTTVADIVNTSFKPDAAFLASIAGDEIGGLAGTAAELTIAALGEDALPSLSLGPALGFDNGLPESIGEYATGRAVDGLFLLVGEEERKIRTDPLARVNDILKKVFGSPEAEGTSAL